MIRQLQEGLEQLESDANVGAVVIASSLPNMFSAGIDLTQFTKPYEGPQMNQCVFA